MGKITLESLRKEIEELKKSQDELNEKINQLKKDKIINTFYEMLKSIED